MAPPALAQIDVDRLLTLFWHPVCTLDELGHARPGGCGPLGVELLGKRLVIANLSLSPSDSPALVAMTDRCLHRSTRLSAGWVDDGAIRCAYHGWRWAADGRCVEIPAQPSTAIPARACIEVFEATVAYGLVWVRLDASAATSLPSCPAWDEREEAGGRLRVVPGPAYSWPTSAPRRVENFVDLAHFAWVHDGSLGRRDEPVPPVPAVERSGGELRFTYDPPPLERVDDKALLGWSSYRMTMPLTVNIEFRLSDGATRVLWMTASPLTTGSCRSFWLLARDDRKDEDDRLHLAFQDQILREDEPVVCNQDPPEIPLNPGDEISIRTDKVSHEYRQWLRELVLAARSDPATVGSALGLDVGASC
jgi:phenylpropionate dioxygenase-like ring-hydroxylating dioxygenase large terminal subunit